MIRPLKAITSQFKIDFKDFIAKNKKLAWILENIDKDFKDSYEDERQLSKVLDKACAINEIHNPEYKKLKVRQGTNVH